MLGGDETDAGLKLGAYPGSIKTLQLEMSYSSFSMQQP